MKTIDRQRLPQVTELLDQHALLQIAGSSQDTGADRTDEIKKRSKASINVPATICLIRLAHQQTIPPTFTPR